MSPLAHLAALEQAADVAQLRLDMARQELADAEADRDEAAEAVRTARRALAASHVANDTDTAADRRRDHEWDRGFHAEAE